MTTETTTTLTVPEPDKTPCSNMTLAESADFLNSVFQERFDIVNDLWKQVECLTLPLHYGQPIMHVYYSKQFAPDEPVTHQALAILHREGKWGIYRAQYQADTPTHDIRWVSIHKCTARVRVTATTGIEGLIKAAINEAGRFLPAVNQAIENLQKVLDPFVVWSSK